MKGGTLTSSVRKDTGSLFLSALLTWCQSQAELRGRARVCLSLCVCVQGVLRGLEQDGSMTNCESEKQPKQPKFAPAVPSCLDSHFLQLFSLGRKPLLSQKPGSHRFLLLANSLWCFWLFACSLISLCIKLDLKSSLRGGTGKPLCSWILVFQRFSLKELWTCYAMRVMSWMELLISTNLALTF